MPVSFEEKFIAQLFTNKNNSNTVSIFDVEDTIESEITAMLDCEKSIDGKFVECAEANIIRNGNSSKQNLELKIFITSNDALS